MSNVNSDRRVEGDWCSQPIPPNVIFGEGFYCESAQIFRHLKSKVSRAVVIGNHVSCYAGCSFALGVNGTCSIGDFTLMNGALVMAEERIEIGSQVVSRRVRTYSEVEPGSLVALTSSQGLLEIAVNRGHASRLLQAGTGATVVVRGT